MQALKNSNGPSHHKKPQLNSEAFPALSSSAAPSAPPQWITKPKEKSKPVKAKSPPTPKEATYNQVADFPTLPVNNKSKNKKAATPVAQPQPQPKSQPKPQSPPTPTIQTNNTKASKKEKRKQASLLDEESNDYTYVNGLSDKFSKQQIKEAYNAAVNVNNNQNVELDRKIKTVETVSSVPNNTDKKRNGGNGDFALAPKEYPPLSKKGNTVPDYPPLTSKKQDTLSKKVANGSVPPGFKARPACDGMTFTNSSGQTFPAPVHTYIPPPDFEQRNRALVKKFAEALGGAAALEDFKVASRAFRDNIISAEDFYQHCRNAMGSHLESLFPDLVALLPDIGKQQELVVGRDVDLEVCSTCGQLVAPRDRISHDTAHWPPLAPH